MKSKGNCYLYLLLFFFLLSRLINLSLLPIFNDEAIYINWGQLMINKPGFLFYSLFDGKQPFLMWFFAVSNKFIADPLLAARLVSVFFSFLTIIAILKLAKKFMAYPFYLLPAVIYLITPLFLFFDRQALMESALTAIGVWSLYLLSEYQEKQTLKPIIELGIVLGMGLLIKSTAIIFLLLSLFFLFYKGITLKSKNRILNPFLAILIISGIVTLILSPLFIQPQFKVIFTRGDRYNLTLKEILSFPFKIWGQNLIASLKISFWHLTPAVFLLNLAGLWISVKKKFYLHPFWFIGGIIIAVLTARGLSPRYLVCLLPLGVFFTGQTLSWLIQKNRIFGVAALTMLFIPLFISISLISNPLFYFNLMDKLTKTYSQKTDYVTGDTAGYGLNQVRQFLEETSKKNPIIVGVRLDAGNPENALQAYYFYSQNIKVINLDKQLFPADFDFNNLKSPVPVYFVSRSQHQGGLEKYLTEVVRFYKPEGKSYFGIYRLGSAVQ